MKSRNIWRIWGGGSTSLVGAVALVCCGHAAPGGSGSAGAGGVEQADSSVGGHPGGVGAAGGEASAQASAGDANGSAGDGGAASCASGQMPCDGRCVAALAPNLDEIFDRVFVRSCALASSCHAGASPKEGFSLTSADAVLGAVGRAARQFSSLSLIEPGHPEDSYLIRKLRGSQIAERASTGTGSVRMPPAPTTPLCEGKIEAIETWIRNGAAR